MPPIEIMVDWEPEVGLGHDPRRPGWLPAVLQVQAGSRHAALRRAPPRTLVIVLSAILLYIGLDR